MIENFIWTDELVAEYGQFFHACFNNCDRFLDKNILEEFKKVKQAEKIKIIVNGSVLEKGKDYEMNGIHIILYNKVLKEL